MERFLSRFDKFEICAPGDLTATRPMGSSSFYLPRVCNRVDLVEATNTPQYGDDPTLQVSGEGEPDWVIDRVLGTGSTQVVRARMSLPRCTLFLFSTLSRLITMAPNVTNP